MSDPPQSTATTAGDDLEDLMTFGLEMLKQRLPSVDQATLLQVSRRLAEASAHAADARQIDWKATAGLDARSTLQEARGSTGSEA